MSDLSDTLRVVLQQLIGKRCRSVIAGHGTGSVVHLEFGEQVPRRLTVRNPYLTEDERTTEGEYDLFIESAWRLELAGEVLCGSTDDDDNDGEMVSGLRRLAGKRVVAVNVCETVPDLTIRFEAEFRLKVFCDQTNLAAGNDNYSIRFGDTILAVGARGRLVREGPRSE